MKLINAAGIQSRGPSLIVCAQLPPPVDGLAFASQRMVEAMTAAGASVSLFNMSGGEHMGARFYFNRIWRSLRAAVAVITVMSPQTRFVYMPISAGLSLFFNIIIAACARIRGKRIILHHHSFSYLDAHDGLVALLLRVAGPETVHIVLCDCMRTKLECVYGKIGNSIGLSSDFYSPLNTGDFTSRAKKDDTTVVMGHLSNLSIEKGLDLCIDLHRRLIERGDAVKLVIGGPCLTVDAERILQRAQVEFPESLSYLGPLDGRAKDSFYRLIDVFLFPTRYRIEADPIVVSDAQAYGLATIAFSRGCLAERINDSVGIAVPPESDFVQAVVKRIPDFNSLQEFANGCGHSARMRHLELRSSADVGFANLFEILMAGRNVDL